MRHAVGRALAEAVIFEHRHAPRLCSRRAVGDADCRADVGGRGAASAHAVDKKNGRTRTGAREALAVGDAGVGPIWAPMPSVEPVHLPGTRHHESIGGARSGGGPAHVRARVEQPERMPKPLVYIVMAYIVMAYTLMPKTTCLCSYGLHSYGLCSYDLHSFGLH